MTTATIEVVPARLLQPGDVFSADGYRVDVAVPLSGRGEVWVEASRADDPCGKRAYVPIDAPMPLWRTVKS
jgi:hypothetical protein